MPIARYVRLSLIHSKFSSRRSLLLPNQIFLDNGAFKFQIFKLTGSFLF